MQTDLANYDGLVDQISACAPDYWDAHALPLGAADIASALAHGAPATPAATLAACSSAIAQRWSDKGVRFAAPTDAPDPVTLELLRSVTDAATGLGDSVGGLPDIDAVLAEQYCQIRDASGALVAYLRKQGGAPLLLLNAFGIPLRIWHKLLGEQHDYQIIVPVLSSCNPVHGGMHDSSSVSDLTAQLQALLTQLAFDRVHVLAWCNAGRLGIALLEQCGARIGQLVLLSPTLRGGETDPAHQSPYESNLLKLFRLVRSSPKSATVVAAMLGKAAAPPDWAGLSDPAARAATLFGLARRELAADLSLPMARPESLIHYALRTHSDEAISASQGAPLPTLPITLVQGEHDAVVSNAQARHWLGRFAAQVDVYQVSGAGHYIQDLQFSYLKLILDRVIHAAPGASSPSAIPLPERIRFQ